MNEQLIRFPSISLKSIHLGYNIRPALTFKYPISSPRIFRNYILFGNVLYAKTSDFSEEVLVGLGSFCLWG